MLTEQLYIMMQNIVKMQSRQIAALSALKFFTDIKDIKLGAMSDFDSKEVLTIIDDYRNADTISIMGSFDNAARTGFGNCLEHTAIVYASLVGNPRISHNSVVACCELMSDHSFVIVTDKDTPCSLVGWTKFNKLSKNTMVVDGWTRDFYFPNINTMTASAFGLGLPATQTPMQRHFRAKCKHSKCRAYYDIPILPQSEPPLVWQMSELFEI